MLLEDWDGIGCSVCMWRGWWFKPRFPPFSRSDLRSSRSGWARAHPRTGACRLSDIRVANILLYLSQVPKILSPTMWGGLSYQEEGSFRSLCQSHSQQILQLILSYREEGSFRSLCQSCDKHLQILLLRSSYQEEVSFRSLGQKHNKHLQIMQLRLSYREEGSFRNLDQDQNKHLQLVQFPPRASSLTLFLFPHMFRRMSLKLAR